MLYIFYIYILRCISYLFIYYICLHIYILGLLYIILYIVSPVTLTSSTIQLNSIQFNSTLRTHTFDNAATLRREHRRRIVRLYLNCIVEVN